MQFLYNTRIQGLLLFALAFLLYANTLGHDFVLDDRMVVTENKWVQQGLSGIPQILTTESFSGYLAEKNAENTLPGGRFRPLSLAFFALLFQFFGNSSTVFHLFSVLLFAANGLMLYLFLLKALKPTPEAHGRMFAVWAASLLFVVHPVHTEVVANVKSCDEQLALLAGIGTLYALLRAFDGRSLKWAAATALLFLAACLGKENAVPLLLVAPLVLWFFRDVSPGKSLAAAWPMALSFAAYTLLRGVALDWHFSGQTVNDPLNDPFLKALNGVWAPFSTEEKAATILYTLFEYLRLLVWPWPLTHDYFPFTIEPQSFVRPGVIAGIILYLLMLGFAVAGLRRKNTAAFGILFYVLTLGIVVNIIAPVGVFMAERFLFMPSVGFCLSIGVGLAGLADRFGQKFGQTAILVALAALVLAATTFNRNKAWANEERLYKTDMEVSANSAKLRNGLGTVLLVKALATSDNAARQTLLEEAEAQLHKAIELHPTYFDALLAHGACVFYLQKFDQSVASYRGAVRLNPTDAKAKLGLAYALRYGGDYYAADNRNPEKALSYLSEAWQINPDTAIATHIAGQYYALGEMRESAIWLEQALNLAPGDQRLTVILGKVRALAAEKEK